MKPAPFILALLGAMVVLSGEIPSPASGQTTSKAPSASELYQQAEQKSQQGDLRGALDAYTAALQLAPDDASIYNNRGRVRSELGDIEGAIADATRSIQLDSNNSVAYYNRSIAHKALGNVSNALADVNRAIQINANWGDGSLGEAYQMRGEVWLKLTNRQRASADFRQALALGTKEDLSKELTTRLEQAVRSRQWEEAVFLVDVMIGTFPQQSDELRAYRNRLKRM
jgi:tetratricopeptide (TPR) repeat protein